MKVVYSLCCGWAWYNQLVSGGLKGEVFVRLRSPVNAVSSLTEGPIINHSAPAFSSVHLGGWVYHLHPLNTCSFI